jgi:putative nucleotidyltransferase with HDIG domain
MMTTKRSVEEFLALADRLPAFPQIVFRILDELADESANVDSLTAHITADPAVVARLLAAANTAAVGHGKRVATVQQAVMMLGVAKVRNIVTTTAIIDRFAGARGCDSARMWRHSVGVALCAQQVARHAGLDTDIAYTAGLLHDIGQLLLFAVDFEACNAVRQYQHQHDLDLVAAEHELLGLDHAQVGGALAEFWKLPRDVVMAITEHHASDEAPPGGEMADAVHVGEILSEALEFGVDAGAEGDWVPRVSPLSELACARMGIEWRRFAEYFPLIEARFDATRLALLL